jgi:hypothetical protein
MNRELKFQKKLSKVYAFVFVEGLVEFVAIIYCIFSVFSNQNVGAKRELSTSFWLPYSIFNIIFPLSIFMVMTILYRQLKYNMQHYHWFEYKKHRRDMKIYYTFMSLSNVIIQVLPMVLILDNHFNNSSWVHWFGWI